ncbi:hypothetical protein BTVI_13415 [Pitangus sulphuratus]|nr:hypothetical protein BTVI_13415 [Pitangus sulphuratus]
MAPKLTELKECLDNALWHKEGLSSCRMKGKEFDLMTLVVPFPLRMSYDFKLMDLHGFTLSGKAEHGTARGFGPFVDVAINNPEPEQLIQIAQSSAATVTGLSVENPPN